MRNYYKLVRAFRKVHHITYIKIHTGAAVLQKQKQNQNQNHSQSSPKFGNAIYQMFANVDPKYIKKHCEFRASLMLIIIKRKKNQIHFLNEIKEKISKKNFN